MSEKTLEQSVEDAKKDLANPVPDAPSDQPKSKTKEKKMAVKKKAAPVKAPAKKVMNGKTKPAPEATAKRKTVVDGDTVTLATLAEEAGISGQRARQKIRGAELSREGRWAWRKGSRELAAARKALDLPAK